MSSGSTCAVVGCHNNSRKFKILSETSCFEHQQLRRNCPCPAPYALHSMPRNDERKTAWLAALKLKHPPKRVYVCSFHFFKKKPTELHADLELYLGYDRPPPKKRRKLIRLTVSETASSSNEDIEGRPRKLNCNVTGIPCFMQQDRYKYWLLFRDMGEPGRLKLFSD